MKKLFLLILLTGCVDTGKQAIGAISSGLQLFPDTANHVICYSLAGANKLSCVHVDHPIVYQIETTKK